MRNFVKHVAFVMVAGLAVGCGGGNETGLSPAELSKEICQQQIECGYQLASQQTCEALFVQFFDEGKLADCYTCVDAEECTTEQSVCSDTCTL